MTVLQRNEAPGLTPSAKRTIGALALVVVGVGAALGLSQLVDDDGSAAVPQSFDSAVAARYAENLTRTGEAQIATAPAVTGGMTLQDELAAIQARTGVAQAVTGGMTLQDELAAIQARTGVPQSGTSGSESQSTSGPR